MDFKKLPPHFKGKVRKTNIHNVSLYDEYYELRNSDDVKVIEYLNAENEYTQSLTSEVRERSYKIRDEFLSRIKESDMSVPEKIDDYFYYSRTEKGKQYRIHSRKKETLQSSEEILIDMNELARGKSFLSLGGFDVSTSHNMLAYLLDDSGDERYSMRVKEISSGKEDLHVIENVAGFEWANDNEILFYTLLDESMRPYKLMRRKVNTPPSEDVLVYEEDDEAFELYVEKTKNNKYIVIASRSNITTEERYIPADKPFESPALLIPRKKGVEYYLSNHKDYFYVLTNDDAENFRIVKVKEGEVNAKALEDYVAHNPKIRIESVECFEDFLVSYQVENGLEKIFIKRFSDGASHYIDFSEEVYSLNTARNNVFNKDKYRFSYSSLVTPEMIIDYDMNTREKEVLKQKEVYNYEPDKYEAKRLFASSHGGVRVPLSLVYKKGIKLDGKNPLLLNGYGAYGHSYDTSFDSKYISLLERGFVIAIAHVRGGEELGRAWYEGGKFFNKKNSFYDFIACAEYLIDSGYTSSDTLAIAGGSAGGLLMGAVMNMRGDLFKVCVSRVPFVDLINTMLDESLPLTVIEYDEWGNPNEEKYFNYMLSYSPYDNVKEGPYPNILFTVGLNDPRVGYWEGAKYILRVRKMRTNDTLALLKINMQSGHFGASGRYDHLIQEAFNYAFVLDVMGLKD